MVFDIKSYKSMQARPQKAIKMEISGFSDEKSLLDFKKQLLHRKGSSFVIKEEEIEIFIDEHSTYYKPVLRVGGINKNVIFKTCRSVRTVDKKLYCYPISVLSAE